MIVRPFGSDRWLPAFALLLVLLLMLPSVPEGPRVSSKPLGAAPGDDVPGRVVVAPAYSVPISAKLLGAVPRAAPTDVLVGLAGRDPAGLAARVALEETPGNPLYGVFLTPGQLRASYGPSASDVDAGLGYFRAQGLNATPSADGEFLQVTGSSGGVAEAFHTSFSRYLIGDRTVFAHPSPASLPIGIPWSGVLGLGNTTPVQPFVPAAHPEPGIGPAVGCPLVGAYLPCGVLRAYNGSTLLASGINGSGLRVAVVDAYDSSEPQGQLASDLAAFERQNGLPIRNASYIYPVPTNTNLNASAGSGWGTEEALDIEWARGMAPGASEEMVLAPNSSAPLYYSVDWIVAHDAADAISLSWGEPDVGIYDPSTMPCETECNATTDGSYTLLHPVLEAAAAEGIGVFAATGDCGASGGTEGDSTDYPSSDPYVTGIGATVLSTVPGSGSYSSESGWSGNSPGACNNGGGSGGGFSPYPRPPWQVAPGFPSNSTARGIPDVSLVGGPSQVNITMYGQEFGVGGTSAGTPMWADLELLADQDAGHRLGNLNPSLYALARIGPYGHYFHDVTSGNNGYAAGTGWDPVTGLGSPIFSTLVPALLATAAPSDGLSVQLYGAPRIGRAPLTTTFTVAVHVGTPPVQFIDVGFGDGNATLLPDPRNHTGAFTVDHTYVRAGVFAATATVVDGSDNSSTGPPIAVVVGGGQALNVSLDLSTNASSLGAGVLLTANVTGGTGPYSYSYFYGDGTYAIDSASSSSTHPYDAVGGDCAAVVVMDSASPVDGGTSARVGIAVGGASAPVCPSAAAMTAQIAATVPAADLPGDLAFQVNTTGGVPPVSVQYASDDPYVGACECGIFTTAGNHQVEAFVNDSFDEEARASTNVTLYPAWTMNSSVSATVGTAPLDVAFRVSPTGGHLTASPSVNWSFGDGTTLQGSNETPMHLYTVPGVYTATVLVEDQGGGRASAAWIINVTSSSYRGLQVGASIAPAVEMPAGSPVSFNATATGGVAPYQYRWDLGVNDSAFGANVSQSYSALGCLGLGTCPLNIGLTVKDAAGTSWTRTFQLPGAVRGRSSAVDLTDSGPIANGVTPYPVRLTASASGVLGLVVQWNFGDGNTTTGTTVSHTYYRPGNFNVVETARDPYGDALVRSHTVVVTGVAIPPLQVRASVNQTRGIAPLTVAFNASASGGTGAPYHVYWDFGDKSNLTAGVGYSVVHTYGAGGDYAGFANISDGRGDVQSVPLNLTVYDPTLTSIALNVTPPAITPADPVGISVHVTAVCMKFSVPGCSNGSVALGIRVGPSNTPFSQAAVVGGPAMPNAAGWFNETIGPFPSLSGMVWIWAASLGLNYTGRVYTAVLIEGVLGPCGNDCGTRTPLSLPPWEAFDVLMAGVTGGAAVLVGVLVWRRRSPPNDEAPAVTP